MILHLLYLLINLILRTVIVSDVLGFLCTGCDPPSFFFLPIQCDLWMLIRTLNIGFIVTYSGFKRCIIYLYFIYWNIYQLCWSLRQRYCIVYIFYYFDASRENCDSDVPTLSIINCFHLISFYITKSSYLPPIEKF